ncbi:hypothetical protein NPIL_111671 [Nephila pilipes]|uniref:Uncharacterized protein n=1 Tax=Nephila pilipes TaxID=299642 RepID=A0A8X6R6Z9_NEPPI|nr:hypothetical protein NPIL_111671 [Nephila pilipes]
MDDDLTGADSLSKSKDTHQQFISLLDRGEKITSIIKKAGGDGKVDGVEKTQNRDSQERRDFEQGKCEFMENLTPGLNANKKKIVIRIGKIGPAILG